MYKLSNVQIEPLDRSIYMKPYLMHFTLNGIEQKWHLLQVHDSVAIIIFNITRKVLVFVKQFRPAIYYNSIPLELRSNEIDVLKYPAELGVTMELCAGIVDKDLPVAEIACEEILEECGYQVNSETLEKVCACRYGGGVTGSRQTMFYCEVTDDMKVSKGGGVDEELIEVVEMTISDVQDYISQDSVLSPSNFMFGVFWFFKNKLG